MSGSIMLFARIMEDELGAQFKRQPVLQGSGQYEEQRRLKPSC